MRLFCLEVKRILKSRRTLILIAVASFLAVIMAYLPISFESINRPGENGTVIELNGLDAIQFKREYRQQIYGEVTPEKVADALRTYQKYVQEYGTADDIPLDVYTENITAIRPLLDRLPEAFADPDTGIGADLMEIDPDVVEQSLYEQFASHLNDIMNLQTIFVIPLKLFIKPIHYNGCYTFAPKLLLAVWALFIVNRVFQFCNLISSIYLGRDIEESKG